MAEFYRAVISKDNSTGVTAGRWKDPTEQVKPCWKKMQAF